MKTYIISILCLLTFSWAQSQSYSYGGRGDQKLEFGYSFYGYGDGIKVNYDYGLSDLFSIGAGGNYFFDSDESEDNDYYVYARTNVHLGVALDLPSKFDIYPGLQLGYLSRGDVGFSAYLGLRYFISKRIGLFAELGNQGAAGISINISPEGTTGSVAYAYRRP
jgi:hypothetical protein